MSRNVCHVSVSKKYTKNSIKSFSMFMNHSHRTSLKLPYFRKLFTENCVRISLPFVSSSHKTTLQFSVVVFVCVNGTKTNKQKPIEFHVLFVDNRLRAALESSHYCK